MDRRVVVTGFGCLTAAGMDAESTWSAVTSGRSAIGRMADPATEDWLYPLAAEIARYDPRQLVPDRKLLKVITRPDVLGLNAVSQALEHSALLTHRDTVSDAATFNDRTGVFVGAPASEYLQRYDFLPSLSVGDDDIARFASDAMDRVHPLWLLRTLPNNVLAYTGIHYGFKGANHNFTGHGVGGSQAIAEAHYHLREGSIARAVVVAFDCPAEPEAVTYYGSSGLLSRTGLRPFDTAHDGTVLGEGAGALILETLEGARARGAVVHGEILGSGISSDALGVLGIREDGDGLTSAIRSALGDAEIDAEAIGMVTTHGNGTPASDASEAKALGGVFGTDTAPATGFKWSLGHTIAASGVIESILSLLSLRDGVVPGIPTLQDKAYDCRAADVSRGARSPRGRAAVVVTRGFAGLNSCVVLAAHDG